MNTLKKCIECTLDKEFSAFYYKENLCKKCRNKKANLKAYPNRNAPKGQMSSEARRQAQARYREKHRDKIRAKQREWVKNNLPKVLARTHKYQAAKLNATPKWLTKDQLKQIEAIFVESHRLTKETGVKREVDHIVPLCGREVSGLHVPWNLQILERSKNRQKFNKY
jgi:hypothetical protein